MTHYYVLSGRKRRKQVFHFLGKCCATANIRRLHFGVPFLEPSDLKQAHWIICILSPRSRDAMHRADCAMVATCLPVCHTPVLC